MPVRRFKSFTLIELLIVIAIIAILSGVVISVINPIAQRKKAKQGVQRSTMAKLCQAKVACLGASTTGNVYDCNTWAEIGVNTPQNISGEITWVIAANSNAVGPRAYIYSLADANGDGSLNGSWNGSNPDCRMGCHTYQTFSGTVGQILMNWGSGGCVIQ